MTNKNRIPIVMAADNHYRIPMLVSLLSILKNKSDNTTYTFYFLIPDDFDQKIIEVTDQLLTDFQNEKAHFISMEDRYRDENLVIKHTAVPTYYRLSLPELIQEDKCIYLDVDTIILSDLYDLFTKQKDDELISGVKAAGYYWPLITLKDKADKLGIAKFDSYVNAGVLVMNLSLLRKMKISKKCQTLLNKKWEGQDQDILNSVCYDHIGILPPKFNSMTKYLNHSSEYYDSDKVPFLKHCYSKEEWQEACENPLIIHYADELKPWDTIKVSHSHLWWKYLRLLDSYYPCYDDCFYQLYEKENGESDQDPRFLKTLDELHAIQNSVSFKIGRIITFPLRKIRNRFR